MIHMLTLITNPKGAILEIGQKAKAERIRIGYRLQDLSQKSGVSYGSLRRFEKTGEIAFEGLVKILSVYGKIPELNSLFNTPPIVSLDDLNPPSRKRGKRGGIL